MNKKGFTLIELMAVLMILAVVVLITTPIVIKLISSSQENSYKNSIIAYGKAVENAIAVKRTQSGKTSDSIEDIEDLIKTTGNEVKCVDTIGHTGSGIVLRGCQVVKGDEAKTKNTYIYINGQIELDGGEELDKNTVLAYGNALKQAIARYKEIYNKLPKTISELEKAGLIKIKGKNIYLKCDDEILYQGEEIYLKNCNVFGKNYSVSLNEMKTVEIYDEYSIGDEVTLNNDKYYVISNSSISQNYVTLLKANPLTLDEVNTYGQGHINRYTYSPVGQLRKQWGYGGLAYYSSITCGYPEEGGTYVDSGCAEEKVSSYNNSDIKHIVDNWEKDEFKNNELVTDGDGYKARLITIAELENLGYVKTSYNLYKVNDNLPNWIYGTYWYWTMSPYNDFSVWWVSSEGELLAMKVSYYYSVDYGYGVIRPVINAHKSSL